MRFRFPVPHLAERRGPNARAFCEPLEKPVDGFAVAQFLECLVAPLEGRGRSQCSGDRLSALGELAPDRITRVRHARCAPRIRALSEVALQVTEYRQGEIEDCLQLGALALAEGFREAFEERSGHGAPVSFGLRIQKPQVAFDLTNKHQSLQVPSLRQLTKACLHAKTHWGRESNS